MQLSRLYIICIQGGRGSLAGGLGYPGECPADEADWRPKVSRPARNFDSPTRPRASAAPPRRPLNVTVEREFFIGPNLFVVASFCELTVTIWSFLSRFFSIDTDHNRCTGYFIINHILDIQDISNVKSKSGTICSIAIVYLLRLHFFVLCEGMKKAVRLKHSACIPNEKRPITVP